MSIYPRLYAISGFCFKDLLLLAKSDRYCVANDRFRGNSDRRWSALNRRDDLLAKDDRTLANHRSASMSIGH
jgi:hypothetical protein